MPEMKINEEKEIKGSISEFLKEYNEEVKKEALNSLPKNSVLYKEISKDLNSLQKETKKENTEKGKNLEEEVKIFLENFEKEKEKLEKKYPSFKLLNNPPKEISESDQVLWKEALKVPEGSTYTYEKIVKGSSLEKTMIKVFEDPVFNKYPYLEKKNAQERVEFVFSKINTVISRFIGNKMGIGPDKPLPENMRTVIVPAIERFLMDTLKKNGNEGNIAGLFSLNGISIESISSMINGVGEFSKRFTEPYGKAKNLLNIIDFLTLPKNRETTKKLTNPYDIYDNICNSGVWEDDNLDIQKLSFQDFWIEVGNENSSSLKEREQEMREMIGNIKMVENPNTTVQILNLLEKSEEVLKKTGGYREQLFDVFEKTGDILDMGKNFLGIDIFDELKNSSLFWPIADFVLSLLGFSGGIRGLEQEYLKNKVDKSLTPEKRAFVSSVLKKYQESTEGQEIDEKNNAKTHFSSFRKKSKTIPSAEDQEKFNFDYPKFVGSISNKLSEDLSVINPQLLNANKMKIWGKPSSRFVEEKKEGDKKIFSIKVLELKEYFDKNKKAKENFIKDYLNYMAVSLPGNIRCMEAIKSPEDCMTLLSLGLVADQNTVAECIAKGVILPKDLYTSSIEEDNNPKNEKKSEHNENFNENGDINPIFVEGLNGEQLQKLWAKINEELTQYSAPFKAEVVINACKQFWIPPSYLLAVMRNDSRYGTDGLGKTTRNPWNVGNTDDWANKYFADWQKGVNACAKNIKRRIEEYQKKHQNRYPSLKELAENRDFEGNWFLPGKNQWQPNPYRFENWEEKTPFLAYMTDANWPKNLAKIESSFSLKIEQPLLA